jgi:hypothetical protein
LREECLTSPIDPKRPSLKYPNANIHHCCLTLLKLVNGS